MCFQISNIGDGRGGGTRGREVVVGKGVKEIKEVGGVEGVGLEGEGLGWKGEEEEGEEEGEGRRGHCFLDGRNKTKKKKKKKKN